MTYAQLDETQFFPTPEKVAHKMISSLDLQLRGKRCLDPSAGTGTLLEQLQNYVKYSSYRDFLLHAIEIDSELRYTLQGKGFKVIHSDFLTYSEPMEFDIIVMNPPFLVGAQHLLKAWSILAEEGQLICLLNAETVKNPYTKERNLLLDLIQQNGSVENLGKCFEKSARHTSVEVVMIKLTKPAKSDKVKFDTFGFTTHADFKDEEFAANPLASSNFIESLVAQYKSAETAIVERNSFNAKIRFYLQNTGEYGSESLANDLACDLNLTKQIKLLKTRFWDLVFSKAKVAQRTTSSFQKDFSDFRENQVNMAFSVENITEMLLMFFQNYDEIMLNSLIKVFDEATSYHEDNKIHWEGWKTNRGYKLSKKIIWPRGVTYDDCSGFRCYHSQNFLDDLDRVLCYLSGKKFPEDLSYTTYSALRNHCDKTRQRGFITTYSDKFFSDYFEMRMFKKGTVHLTFKDLKLLDDFNQKAAQGKKWMGGKGF